MILPQFIRENNVKPFTILDSIYLEVIKNDCEEQLKQLLGSLATIRFITSSQSQSIIGLTWHTPMEELWEELKDEKGIATSKEEQLYQLTGLSELPGIKPPTKECTWRDPGLQLHMK